MGVSRKDPGKDTKKGTSMMTVKTRTILFFSFWDFGYGELYPKMSDILKEIFLGHGEKFGER